MAYAVLAYPSLQPDDLQQIQDYRQTNDEWLYEVVKPHFSFVFPVTDIPKESFIEEIRNLSTGISCIDFVIRCATINKDSFNDYYHALLVPDEGYSRIVKLHDRLYSGLLKNNLRLDLDFIPHLGIGNSTDASLCKQMVDEWNAKNIEFQGSICELTIVSYENHTIHNLVRIPLSRTTSQIQKDG